MKGIETDESKGKTKWGLIGAVISAFAASICCVGPLVLLALGVSGAWIGNLTALEPYRPIFMMVTLGFLGFAFYRVYRKPKVESCAPGNSCATPRSHHIHRATLWIVTAFSLGLFAFPRVAPHLFASTTSAENAPTTQEILAVKNLTCAACTVTVKKTLTRLDGVKGAKVTLQPPEAVVVFDPARVSIEDLVHATTYAGYPSSVKGEGGK